AKHVLNPGGEQNAPALLGRDHQQPDAAGLVEEGEEARPVEDAIVEMEPAVPERMLADGRNHVAPPFSSGPRLPGRAGGDAAPRSPPTPFPRGRSSTTPSRSVRPS